MTLKEAVARLCEYEGGKRQALDAGQAREALAKMRRIIAEETGIDLYDILALRGVCMDFDTGKRKAHFEAFAVYPWRNGKPVKGPK